MCIKQANQSLRALSSPHRHFSHNSVSVIFRKKEGLKTLLEGQCLQTMRNSDQKTAAHVALECQKTERALNLLEMSGGKQYRDVALNLSGGEQ